MSIRRSVVLDPEPLPATFWESHGVGDLVNPSPYSRSWSVCLTLTSTPSPVQCSRHHSTSRRPFTAKVPVTPDPERVRKVSRSNVVVRVEVGEPSTWT